MVIGIEKESIQSECKGSKENNMKAQRQTKNGVNNSKPIYFEST
jgi:hypothetical protein